MKRPFALLLAVVAVVASAVAAAPSPSTVAAERVAASYLLAFGEPARADELSRTREPGSVTVTALLAEHRQRLQADVAAQQRTAVSAFEDTFGRAPSDAEIMKAGSGIYAELVRRNLEQLSGQPDEYRRVLDRAYQLVIHRPAFDVEVAYWKERPALPYVLLVGCIEGWARRNAPGLMATTGNPCLGVNSALLRTLSVSPAVGAEVRAAFRLQPAETEALAIAAGHNVIAPGANDIVSLGGMFIVVVGDHELVKS